MRKIFLAVAAMAMLATACTKDDSALVGNESLVSFSVSSPELQTRYGEGSLATDLYYAFYEVNNGTLTLLSEISATGDDETGKLEIETLISGKATINVPLVDGRHYAAIFWAQADGAPYTIDWESQTMSYDANVALTVNNEDYDAFYAYYPVSTEKTHKVTLTRPFAQINIATAEEDYENAKKAGFTAAQTKVVVKGVCTSFDLVNGKVATDEQSELTFDWAAIAECDEANCTGKKAGYKNLAMNYVLVEGRRLVTVEMYVNDEDVKRTYTTVPVERNYRTYILGKLLTTTNEFNVTTVPGFNDTTLPETAIEKLIMDIQTVGGEFTLPSDITLDGTLVVRKDVVLNLNGKTLTNKVENAATDVIVVEEGATLTINGEGNVTAVSGNDGYAVISEGTVIINGGTFQAGVDAANDGNCTIYARGKGKVYINGGNFSTPAGDDTAYVLNKKDGDRATTTIEVKGGTFQNFNPANNPAEGAGTNFCAEGFTAYDNGDDTYTVLPALTASLKDVTTDTVVDVTTDMHVATGTTPHTHNATANITINGNGNSVISTAESADDFQWEGGTIPAMSTIFSSANGSKVTVNDLTFEGTMSALMLGHYVNSTYNNYNTELNNVNVVDAEVVSFSAGVSPAVCVYGTAVLNNCNIYGTTLSELDTDPMWPVYDVAAVNYSTTTVNGGKIGSFYVWNQAGVVLDNGAEVETLVIRGNMNTTNYGVTIKAGTKVGAIDLSAITTKTKVNITIEAGATVGKIVANGVEYASVEAFQNTVPVATQTALADALKNGSTTVVVAAGEYTFPAASSIKEGVTIKCEEGTVFTGNSKLNINGAIVEGATFSNPSGTAVDQTINGTFKNCTFTGSNALRWTYAGETVVFEDCVFDGSVYGIHFDGGANDVVFRNCTISGFNGLGSALTMVTFEGCTFVGNGKSGYNGANLWGSAKLIDCKFIFDGTTATEWIDCIGADKTYEFTNCTVNGVYFTADNYTSFDKIFSRNNVTVKINGVDCAM